LGKIIFINVVKILNLEYETALPMKKLQRFDVAFCDIAENLESALEQFKGIYEDLEEKS